MGRHRRDVRQQKPVAGLALEVSEAPDPIRAEGEQWEQEEQVQDAEREADDDVQGGAPRAFEAAPKSERNACVDRDRAHGVPTTVTLPVFDRA